MRKLKPFTRLLATPWATAIGVAAVLSSVRDVIDPSSLILTAAVGQVIAYVWTVVYGLGGIYTVIGIASGQRKYEAAGNVFIAAGATVEGIMLLFFLGISPYVNIWGSLTLFLFGLAGAVRAKHLLKGQVLVLADSS